MGISITGLSSGLDTAQMVADLMAIERIPYTNLTTKKSNLQSEQNIFRSINTKLNSVVSALYDLNLKSTYTSYKAISSLTTAATATATSSAIAGNYTIKVSQIAKPTIIGINGISTSGTTWKDMFQNASASEFATSEESGEDIVFSQNINGKGIDLKKVFKDLDENASDAEKSLEFKDGVTDDQIMKALAGYINKNSADFGVSATMINTSDDGSSYTMTLTSSKTGDSSAINSNFINSSNSQSIQLGQDALISINGLAAMKRDSNTIQDVVDGITFNLVGEGTSTISVEKNYDSLISKIEGFVTAYNDLITALKSNLSKPEDKTKMNPLQGNSLLKTIQTQLYSMFNQSMKMDPDDSKSKSLFMDSIGLSIDSGVTVGSQMTGKIKFDKAKFTSGMETYGEAAVNLLTNNLGNISEQIKSQYTSTVHGLMSNKITGYDSEIKTIDDRMGALERSLEMKEARMKLQFSNMEILLSSLKSEQTWLTSQFEALTKSSR